jgi:trigger factor
LEVNINSLSEVLYEADILVTNEELQPHFERAYEEYRPKAEVRGFRKGRVPLDMIKRLFGEAIEYKALDTVANDVYREAMTERNIRPLGQPSMVDMDFQRGQHLRFKIKYEVKPEITLKNYKGLKIEKPIHTVTDAEVDAEVVHLRRVNSTSAEVQSVTDAEHVVTADVQEHDEAGTPLIGKKSANVRFYLADETLAREIKEALHTAEAGGVYRATVESKHGTHTHPMYLSMTATKIEKVHLPEFDEALVKKLTGNRVTSPEEFQKNLRGDIQRYWDDQAERQVADAIIGEIVRAHEFPVPETLTNSVLDALVDDIRSKSRDKDLPKDFDEKKFREENRAYAIQQAKWLLLREHIAEAEQISVTETEIEQLAQSDAVRTGIAKERLLDYYRNSGAVNERILSDKIISFLKDHAKISEKAMAAHALNT